MSLNLFILGLSAHQIAALRATPALTDDVIIVAITDQGWAETLASMQDDELKERREGIKARIVRSMSPGEREAFEARLMHQEQLFVQRFGSPQDRKEGDARILKSLSPEERQVSETQHRRQRDAMASLLDFRLEDAQSDDEARSRIAGIGVLEELLNLQNGYHDLHYAFTGHSIFTTDPSDAPGDALMTGEPLGKARLHDVAATREFARYINGLDPGQLSARLARSGMWDEIDHRMLVVAHELFGGLFLRFRGYVTRMAEQQYGLLIWLT